jgi:hypothetical protein
MLMHMPILTLLDHVNTHFILHCTAYSSRLYTARHHGTQAYGQRCHSNLGLGYEPTSDDRLASFPHGTRPVIVRSLRHSLSTLTPSSPVDVLKPGSIPILSSLSLPAHSSTSSTPARRPLNYSCTPHLCHCTPSTPTISNARRLP